MSGFLSLYSSFYAHPLGKRFQKRILSTLTDNLWPEEKNLSVLGVGYTMPYMPYSLKLTQHPYIALPFSPEPLISPTPSFLGKICFTEPTLLPFPDHCFDHILLAHVPISTYQLIDLFREARRVLKENGTLTLLLTNRFNPLTCPAALQYEPSLGPLEIENILADLLLRTEQRRYCNFAPLSCSPLPLYQVMDMVGSHLMPFLAGIMLLQCRKEIYAAPPPARPLRIRRDRLVQTLSPHYRSRRLLGDKGE